MSYDDEDDFQNFNDNEADDYRNEGLDEEENGEVCTDCGELVDDCTCEDINDRDDDDEGIEFADPGGNSSLRAASRTNPRNLPCPTCGEPNRLTPADKQLGYQCDSCANRMESGLDY